MAKRSREAIWVPSSSSNSSTEFEDPMVALEESYHIFSDILNDQSDFGDLTNKPLSGSESRKDLEPSSGYKRHRGKSPLQEECAASDIHAKADDHNGIVTHSRPGPCESGLLSRTVTPLKNSSSGPKGSSRCQPSESIKFGMYAGRVKANPLKHLANVLQSKIQPHHEHRNLLEVATEIHDEAENKHNTTLRRIYDVVNVLDAAGLVERMNGNSAAKTAPEDVDEATESSLRSAVKKHNSKGGRHNRGKDSTDKRSARGSTIRWVPPETEEANAIAREALEMEKAAARERVLEKRRQLEALTEELRIKTALIEHNQISYRTLYSHSSANVPSVSSLAQPEEDQSWCTLSDPEDTSQTSANTENKEEMSESHTVTFNPPVVRALRLPFDLFHITDTNDADIVMDDDNEVMHISTDKPDPVLDENKLLTLMFPRSTT